MSTRARATSMRAIRHGQQRTQLARILQWLYGAGEQGIAVPDLTPGNGFLFQDSAGTTPVTAYEQPVGRIVDRSGRGNDIIQATSTKRPTLSARYNLLTYSEQFDNAAWSKSGSTVTQNAGTAPGGALTADKLVENTNNGVHQVSQTVTMPSGATRFTVRAKAAERSVLDIELTDNTTGSIGYRFNLSAVSAVVIGSGSGTSWTSISGSIQSLGDGWCLCTIIGTRGAGTQTAPVMRINNGSSASYLGDGTSGILVWGADLRLTIDTIGQPAYQRVGASNDYDTAGFYPYLAFDGTDDSMATAASVDFTGTDKMTVFAGVTKLSDAAIGIVMEFTSNATGFNGTFWMLSGKNTGASPDWGALSRGTSTAIAETAGGYAAPASSVLAMQSNIAADTLSLRVNGISAATSASDQGTGNYNNATVFLGARNNASLFFNGRMYPFFIRGAATDAGLIAQVEQYIRARMPVNF